MFVALVPVGQQEQGRLDQGRLVSLSLQQSKHLQRHASSERQNQSHFTQAAA